MQEIILKDILSIFAFTINTLISGVWLLKKKKDKSYISILQKITSIWKWTSFFLWL